MQNVSIRGSQTLNNFINHRCCLWLFLISRHIEIMMTSREHFADTVLYFYYHITLLKHHMFFFSLKRSLWSVWWKLEGVGLIRQSSTKFASHTQFLMLWYRCNVHMFYNLQHAILAKTMNDCLFRGEIMYRFAVTIYIWALARAPDLHWNIHQL